VVEGNCTSALHLEKKKKPTTKKAQTTQVTDLLVSLSLVALAF